MPPTILGHGNVTTSPDSETMPAGATKLVVITLRRGESAASLPSSFSWGSQVLTQKVANDPGRICACIWVLDDPIAGTQNLSWVGGTGGDVTNYFFWLEDVDTERDVTDLYDNSAGLITDSVTSEVDDLTLWGCLSTDGNSFVSDADVLYISTNGTGIGSRAGAQGGQSATFDGGVGEYVIVGVSLPASVLGGPRFFGL
jgi:hypothetical protein